MPDDMKITILGTNGSGKTCYLLGMYSKMQMGIEGFSLHTKDFNTHMELNEKIAALIYYKTYERWPYPTCESIECSFDFCYGLKPLVGVNFLDYRGGALADSSKKEDVQKFIEQVKQSDCLFLCISAENLLLTSQMKRARAIRADRINLLIREICIALQPTANKPFPVVFVLTKFDLYPDPNHPQRVIESIQELFPTFWEFPGWIVNICPVSLGRELATNQDSGEIKPINCHIPLLFSAYLFFRKRYLSETKENDKKYMELLCDELVPSAFVYLNGKEVILDVSIKEKEPEPKRSNSWV